MVPYKIAFAVSMLLYNTVCQGSAFVYEDFLAYPKYKVKFTEKKIPESNIFGEHLKNTQQVGWWNSKVEHYDDQKQVIMMSSTGQPFLCTIPTVTPEEEEENNKYKKSNSPESSISETQHTIENGLKLLQPLADKDCLYYQTNSYWTYEYCHMKYVRQFHIDPTKTDGNDKFIIDNKNAYILGKFPEQQQQQPNKASSNVENNKKDTSIHISSNKNNKNNEQSLLQQQQKKTNNDQSSSSSVRGLSSTTLKNIGDKKLLVQRWGGGTLCDKTNQPRITDIQFQCDMHHHGDHISNYQEISTCHYLMTISTPRLCDDSMLTSQKKPKVHQIECNPIVPDHKAISENKLLHDDKQKDASILNNVMEQQQQNGENEKKTSDDNKEKEIVDTNQKLIDDEEKKIEEEENVIKKLIKEQLFGNNEEKVSSAEEELNNMNTNDLINMINKLSKQMDELQKQQEQLEQQYSFSTPSSSQQQQQKPLQAEIQVYYALNENGQLEMVKGDKLLPNTANSEITKAAQALVSQMFMGSKQTNPSANNHEQRKKSSVKESETQQQNKKMYERSYYNTENNQ